MNVAGFVFAILVLFQTADDWYATGVRRAAAGNASEAIAAYRNAVAQNSQHVEAWNNLGDLLRRGGDLKGARDAINHALAINPEHARAALNAALLQIETKNPAGALPFLATARKGLGDLPALEYLSAKVHLELNDYESAEPYLSRFRPSAASSPSGAAELAALLMDQEKYAAAAELLLAIPAARQTPEIRLQLGQSWYALDRLEAARDSFTAFVESAPEDFRGYLWHGYAERGLGDGEAAERQWRKALSLKADSVEALVALADLELDRGRAAESLALSDQAVKLSPSPDVLLVRGLALLRLERPADSAAALSKIPSTAPEYSRALYPLSRAYRQTGDIKKADAALREFQLLEANERNKDLPVTPGRKRP